MPGVSTDSIDVYVFRRIRGRAEFLLLRRRADAELETHGMASMGVSTLEKRR